MTKPITIVTVFTFEDGSQFQQVYKVTDEHTLSYILDPDDGDWFGVWEKGDAKEAWELAPSFYEYIGPTIEEEHGPCVHIYRHWHETPAENKGTRTLLHKHNTHHVPIT